MENTHNNQLIAEVYETHRYHVYCYIFHRINHTEDAEDLLQDVFVRLMDYKRMICKETVMSFLFTIAHNIVMDYLRLHYKKQEMNSYLFETTVTCSNEVESKVVADDLAYQEECRMKLLPPQRRTIYRMIRYEEKTVADVSAELNLSFRTVENHLRMGRKEIREYIRLCI